MADLTAPPAYTAPGSPPRSSSPTDGVHEPAETMVVSSLPAESVSVTSTATTLPAYRESQETNGLQMPDAKSEGVTRRAEDTSGTATRERLRQAEIEINELRRRVNEERAITDRLKREGRGVGLTASEARQRVLQLRNDVKHIAAETPRRATSGLFASVCSTDLMFLIDTTASMGSYINAAKDQVRNIIKDIKRAFLNAAEVRIAIVGYKDHGDTPGIQFLDFTTSADEARMFLDKLRATGGADTPENVLGGMWKALNASWRNQTRCMIHIADAPAHGNDLHDLAESADSYFTPGSEPHGHHFEPLIKQMVTLNVNYAFLRINDLTDKMALEFLKVYAGTHADCKLHKLNKYYTQACEISNDFANMSITLTSKQSAKGGLLFEESELGTSYKQLRHLVVKNVTTSASRTAVRSSGSGPRKSHAPTDKLKSTGLAAIDEDEDAPQQFGGSQKPKVQLENIPARWDQKSFLDETLMVEGFSPDVGVHGAGTLNDMMAHDDNIKMSIAELTIYKRSKPFAQGAMRVAAYAKTASSNNKYVVKSFKKDGKLLGHLAEDMRCQALCKAFALEFNALSGEERSIDFLSTTCLRGKVGTGLSEECLSLEPYIPGKYLKYNNNCGYVNEDLPEDDRINMAAQAFSHFTFERSQGQFMVTDLQGVENIFTDPAIHTKDPERFKLADTNLGEEGFKFFFATHVCNDICTKLGLQSDASMMIENQFDFRKDWPGMDNTVCCSNKLCGKILRLSSAKKTNDFPGFNWCDVCFPQLHSTIVDFLCVEQGAHHEFEASRFFYESQGRMVPRKCVEHREEDPAMAMAAPAEEEKVEEKNSKKTRRVSPRRQINARDIGALMAGTKADAQEGYAGRGADANASRLSLSGGGFWARIRNAATRRRSRG